MSERYFAVRVGRNPGIYLSWDGEKGAEAQIAGVPDADYAEFSSREEAEVYLDNGEDTASHDDSVQNPIDEQTIKGEGDALDNEVIDMDADMPETEEPIGAGADNTAETEPIATDADTPTDGNPIDAPEDEIPVEAEVTKRRQKPGPKRRDSATVPLQELEQMALPTGKNIMHAFELDFTDTVTASHMVPFGMTSRIEYKGGPLSVNGKPVENITDLLQYSLRDDKSSKAALIDTRYLRIIFAVLVRRLEDALNKRQLKPADLDHYPLSIRLTDLLTAAGYEGKSNFKHLKDILASYERLVGVFVGDDSRYGLYPVISSCAYRKSDAESETVSFVSPYLNRIAVAGYFGAMTHDKKASVKLNNSSVPVISAYVAHVSSRLASRETPQSAEIVFIVMSMLYSAIGEKSGVVVRSVKDFMSDPNATERTYLDRGSENQKRGKRLPSITAKTIYERDGQLRAAVESVGSASMKDAKLKSAFLRAWALLFDPDLVKLGEVFENITLYAHYSASYRRIHAKEADTYCFYSAADSLADRQNAARSEQSETPKRGRGRPRKVVSASTEESARGKDVSMLYPSFTQMDVLVYEFAHEGKVSTDGGLRRRGRKKSG